MEIQRSSGLMWDYTKAKLSAPSCLSIMEALTESKKGPSLGAYVC